MAPACMPYCKQSIALWGIEGGQQSASRDHNLANPFSRSSCKNTISLRADRDSLYGLCSRTESSASYYGAIDFLLKYLPDLTTFFGRLQNSFLTGARQSSTVNQGLTLWGTCFDNEEVGKWSRLPPCVLRVVNAIISISSSSFLTTSKP